MTDVKLPAKIFRNAYDKTLKFQQFPFPSYIPSEQAITAAKEKSMKKYRNYLVANIIQNINNQLSQFDEWNIALLSNNIVDVTDIIKPLNQKIDKELGKVRNVLNSPDSTQYLSSLTRLYQIVTEALSNISQVYYTVLNDLESTNDLSCQRKTTEDTCLKQRFKVTAGSLLSRQQLSEEPMLCEWRKKSLVGISYGQPKCYSSPSYRQYISEPSKKGSYISLVGKEERNLSDFLQHPIEHALYSQ